MSAELVPLNRANKKLLQRIASIANSFFGVILVIDLDKRSTKKLQSIENVVGWKMLRMYESNKSQWIYRVLALQNTTMTTMTTATTRSQRENNHISSYALILCMYIIRIGHTLYTRNAHTVCHDSTQILPKLEWYEYTAILTRISRFYWTCLANSQ